MDIGDSVHHGRLHRGQQAVLRGAPFVRLNVPCLIASATLALRVSHRRFPRRLSARLPLLWHASIPGGHGPTKASSTSR